MEVAVLILALALAAANGANDIPKGVATLAGAGVTRTRTALVWGTVTTAIGCLVSLRLAAKLTALFSKGIVTAHPTPAFAVAVLTGTVAWVALATWRVLPVSTTHALTGSLLGAGTLFAADAVQWHVLVQKVIYPLLLSVLAAWAISALLNAGARQLLDSRARAKAERPTAAQPAAATDGGAAVATATVAAPAAVEQRKYELVNLLHWCTSGLTGFARGMNDTPKIVAVGSFVLVGGLTTTHVLIGVTLAMALGGLLAGYRMADRLATGVVTMSHREGFLANLTTAGLVGLGAFRGWPMSTTQVSIGAISGISGKELHRLRGKALRDFAIGWLVTPIFAAAVAMLAYLLLR